MIKYKEKQITTTIIDKVFCDKCKKEITEEEIDEMQNIRFAGGYFSVFGDGVLVRKCYIWYRR